MAQTIAEKALAMAEANAELKARVLALEEIEKEKDEKSAKLEEEIDQLKKSLQEKEDELEALKSKGEKDEQEKEEMKGQIEELSKTLSLSPEVRQSEGAEAVKEIPEGAEESKPQSWQQALAACNGDYVAARKAHPKLFDKYIESSKTNKGA